MHEGAPAALSCPFCGAKVSGWGSHMLAACPKLAQGMLMAFRSVAGLLVEEGWSLEWTGTASFWAVPAGGELKTVALIRDNDLPERDSHHLAYVLWSGLWVNRDQEAGQQSVHRQVLQRYAAALEDAMKEDQWPLFQESELVVRGASALPLPWRVAES